MFNVCICNVLISTTMKLFFVFFVILMSSIQVFSQLSENEPDYLSGETFEFHGNTIHLDQKMINYFGLTRINELKNSNEDYILYMNFYVQNAYEIKDIGIKSNEYQENDISKITKNVQANLIEFDPSNPSSFNILAYDIIVKDDIQVILTNHDNEAIIVSSKKKFLEKYNLYRDQLLKKS
jgi:hypothetical protein